MCDADLGGYTVYQYATQDFDCNNAALSITHYNSSKTACQTGNPDSYITFCSTKSSCQI
jgi:hypothetical protein